MSKKSTRWPIWKIGVAAGGCAVSAAVLFWLSVFLENVSSGDGTDPASQPLLTLPGFILILGVVATMLLILSLIWLTARFPSIRPSGSPRLTARSAADWVIAPPSWLRSAAGRSIPPAVLGL